VIKYISLLVALLLLPTLVACKGTLDVGVEQTPTLPTSTPTTDGTETLRSLDRLLAESVRPCVQ